MIKIIAGGKKSAGWVLEAQQEYEKRLKKPFDIKWEIYEEEKLAKKLANWEFKPQELVILTDERGANISSVELSEKLVKAFNTGLSAYADASDDGGANLPCARNCPWWKISS